MFNGIIDLNHDNGFDLQKIMADGVKAVIHKATEGATVQDDRYHARRQLAKDAGLLWGAYHFSSNLDAKSQVDNFLSWAAPGDDELIALDWEKSSAKGAPNMTLAQAREFVTLVKDRTGRWPLVYGGDVLREAVGSKPDPVLANCPLWYVRILDTPKGIPTAIWPTYTLWQYSDGKDGFLDPVVTAGSAGADRNTFEGSADDLAAQWPFTRSGA